MSNEILKPFLIDGVELKISWANLTNTGSRVRLAMRFAFQSHECTFDLVYGDVPKFLWNDHGNFINTRSRIKIEDYILENFEKIYYDFVKLAKIEF